MVIHCYTSQDAWNVVIQAVEEIKKSNLATKLYSVVLYGSLVRGDFIDNVSDIDLIVVLKNAVEPSTGQQVSEIFKRVAGQKGIHVDAPYLLEEKLPLKGKDQQLIKQMQKCWVQFGFFAFDILQHHKILYGEDFVEKLEIPNPLYAAKDRIKHILENEVKCYPCQMDKWAWELVKAIQVIFSRKPTLNKEEVLQNFTLYVPDFPLKSFAKEILEGYKKKSKRDEVFLKRCEVFIRQIEKLICKTEV